MTQTIRKFSAWDKKNGTLECDIYYHPNDRRAKPENCRFCYSIIVAKYTAADLQKDWENLYLDINDNPKILEELRVAATLLAGRSFIYKLTTASEHDLGTPRDIYHTTLSDARSACKSNYC